MAYKLLIPLPDRTTRTERDEHIKAEHGRRQNQWKGYQSLDQKLPSPMRVCQPVSHRTRDQNQQRADDGGELRRERNRLPVKVGSQCAFNSDFICGTSKPYRFRMLCVSGSKRNNKNRLALSLSLPAVVRTAV